MAAYAPPESTPGAESFTIAYCIIRVNPLDTTAKKILKVGLTGGIGCGKSTVAEMFAAQGWSVLQADAIVKDLLSNDVEVQSALRERWKGTVFRSDGTVDRKAIAKQVFGNKRELSWLESLLHPRVRSVWETALAKSPKSHWLVEIPLLFEKKLETKFDLVVCIESSPKVVENRMVQRGYSLNEVTQRRLQQMPLEEKICRSDHIISNSGNLEFLKLQTTRLIKQIE